MIQNWTMKQWRAVWDMVQGNEWKLSRFVDKDKDDQIDVWLISFCAQEVGEERVKLFGGRVRRLSREGSYASKGLGSRGGIYDTIWNLRDEELDNFLDNLWILISKKDPYYRSTDIRQAQDIRRRVREGNSYPFYDPRSAKGNRERLGLQRPRLLRNSRSP
jgi:hypothetical protein